MVKDWIKNNLLMLLGAIITLLIVYICYLQFVSYIDNNKIEDLQKDNQICKAEKDTITAKKETVEVNRDEIKSALENQNDEIEKMRQNTEEQKRKISNLQYKLNSDLTASRNSLKDMNLTGQCKQILSDIDKIVGRRQ